MKNNWKPVVAVGTPLILAAYGFDTYALVSVGLFIYLEIYELRIKVLTQDE